MNIYRQKLINAVLFFTKETKHANMTKMMKLLNFFDFDHFSQTGYPAIGLKYYAFKQGPVPKDFWLEVKDKNVPEDFEDKISIREMITENGKKETRFIPKRNAQVDFDLFTPRERKILEKLAYIYKDATAKEMSDISHEDNLPWDITIKEKGINAFIDYLLALDEDSPINQEEAVEELNDFFSVLHNFDIKPTNK